jgi:hypothetical protein
VALSLANFHPRRIVHWISGASARRQAGYEARWPEIKDMYPHERHNYIIKKITNRDCRVIMAIAGGVAAGGVAAGGAPVDAMLDGFMYGFWLPGMVASMRWRSAGFQEKPHPAKRTTGHSSVPVLSIARDFAREPVALRAAEGKFSAEIFRRDFLQPMLALNDFVRIDVEGARLSRDWMQIAFGGLVADDGMDPAELTGRLLLKGETRVSEADAAEIRDYIAGKNLKHELFPSLGPKPVTADDRRRRYEELQKIRPQTPGNSAPNSPPKGP